MHPLILTLIGHQPRITQILKVPRNPRLWRIQNFHKITNTQALTLRQQEQTAQTRRITQGFKEFGRTHHGCNCIYVYANMQTKVNNFALSITLYI